MTRTHIPQSVLDAAHARSVARSARDWAEADRLRTEIETAGWKVVDRGTDFALSPAAAPDLLDGRRVRYGSSASVPTRADDPDRGTATVVLVATEQVEGLDSTLTGLRASAPTGTSIVIVADDPSVDQAAALEALPASVDLEVVWTAARLGHATAVNIGLRRASGPVVVLVGPGIEVEGDFVTPIVRALEDPTVAVVGPWGSVSADGRAFADAPPGDADVIEGGCQAFRRVDAVARGPLDERFGSDRHLERWWSLALRDAGEAVPPRRAVRLAGLPIAHRDPRDDRVPEPGRDRSARRDSYRVMDRFGRRRDLFSGG